jgi:Tetratricopeptide repeat
MSNLAQRLFAQGDFAGARALQERVLEVRPRVLGQRHPETAISAWNLFVTLKETKETTAAQEVFGKHLAWLLQVEPQDPSGAQQRIREWLSRQVKS